MAGSFSSEILGATQRFAKRRTVAPLFSFPSRRQRHGATRGPESGASGPNGTVSSSSTSTFARLPRIIFRRVARFTLKVRFKRESGRISRVRTNTPPKSCSGGSTRQPRIGWRGLSKRRSGLDRRRSRPQRRNWRRDSVLDRPQFRLTEPQGERAGRFHFGQNSGLKSSNFDCYSVRGMRQILSPFDACKPLKLMIFLKI